MVLRVVGKWQPLMRRCHALFGIVESQGYRVLASGMTTFPVISFTGLQSVKTH